MPLMPWSCWPTHGPASASRLTITQISVALTRARRRNIAGKATRIQAVLRGQYLG